MVFAIVVHELNGDTELSHLTMLPVCPLSVNVPLVVPEQIVVPPPTLPATVAGSTDTVVVDEFAAEHAPL